MLFSSNICFVESRFSNNNFKKYLVICSIRYFKKVGGIEINERIIFDINEFSI